MQEQRNVIRLPERAGDDEIEDWREFSEAMMQAWRSGDLIGSVGLFVFKSRPPIYLERGVFRNNPGFRFRMVEELAHHPPP